MTAAGFTTAATRSATAGWTSPSTNPTPSRARAPLPPRTARAALGAIRGRQRARRPGQPDRTYYQQAAERLGGNRACLALARKLLKRCYHTLRELGDDALAPFPQTRCRAASPDSHRCAAAGSRDTAADHSAWTASERMSGRNASPSGNNRGRDASCPTPPAQIPACALTHWAPPSGFGVEAHGGPGVKDAGFR